MTRQEVVKKIREKVEEFFQKMGFEVSIEISFEKENSLEEEDFLFSLNINTKEAQLLIGEKGQTLNDIQHLLRAILKKEIKEKFNFNLDISDYKKKKNQYLIELARSIADEVALTKKEKELPPMSSYERRLIHLELGKREDVKTESIGQEPERKVVIKPRL
jgi:spoIIIJ-associated protein